MIAVRTIGHGDLAIIPQLMDIELLVGTQNKFHRCRHFVTPRVSTEGLTDGFGLDNGIFWQVEIDILLVFLNLEELSIS
jgi:hypothetical protein